MKLHLFIFFISFSAICFSQNRVDIECNSIKYDTICRNIIVEINADNYYTAQDAILQGNNMFIDNNYNKHSLINMYNSDTIILQRWDLGRRYWQNKNCLNLSSILDFENHIDSRRLSKKGNQKLKRSIFKDKNGIAYVRIWAKVVIIDAGSQNFLIPKIYSLKQTECKWYNKYCERRFANALILANVLEWRLR